MIKEKTSQQGHKRITLTRRVLLFTLCVALASSLFMANVLGASGAVITVGQAIGEPGQTVTVTLSLDSNPGLAAMALQVSYDETRLRIANHEAVSRGIALATLSFIGVDETSFRNNPFTTLWFGAVNDTFAGVLLNITFTIRDDAPAGFAYVNVNLNVDGAVNLNEQLLAVSVTQGGVTVSRNGDTGGQSPAVTEPTLEPTEPTTPPVQIPPTTPQETPTPTPGSAQTQPPTNVPAQTQPPTGSQAFMPDAEVRFIDTEELPNQAHPLVEDNRVFEVQGEQSGVRAAISVPHILQQGVAPGSLVVYRVGQDGVSLERVIMSRFNNETGEVEFVGTVGGLYFVSANYVEFVDVSESRWYHNAITFTAARGLFGGIGENRFAPNLTMTRAMFIRALANLDGVYLSDYTLSPFVDTDIASWYGPSVAWARELGIIDEGILSGLAPGNFNPGGDITREQMAVIFANYINARELILTEQSVEIFADLGQANEWARDAIQSMRRHSIVTGVGDNRYNPMSTATRAEVATIFSNLINAMIN